MTGKEVVRFGLRSFVSEESEVFLKTQLMSFRMVSSILSSSRKTRHLKVKLLHFLAFLRLCVKQARMGLKGAHLEIGVVSGRTPKGVWVISASNLRA